MTDKWEERIEALSKPARAAFVLWITIHEQREEMATLMTRLQDEVDRHAAKQSKRMTERLASWDDTARQCREEMAATTRTPQEKVQSLRKMLARLKKSEIEEASEDAAGRADSIAVKQLVLETEAALLSIDKSVQEMMSRHSELIRNLSPEELLQLVGCIFPDLGSEETQPCTTEDESESE